MSKRTEAADTFAAGYKQGRDAGLLESKAALVEADKSRARIRTLEALARMAGEALSDLRGMVDRADKGYPEVLEVQFAITEQAESVLTDLRAAGLMDDPPSPDGAGREDGE